MGECKDCTQECTVETKEEMQPGQVPNISITIHYHDYRVMEDNSNYIDNVEMSE